MLHYHNVVIIEFQELTVLLHAIESNDDFPTIDVDALLSLIFEAFIVNRNARAENILWHLLNSDFLSDKMDLEEVHRIKLEAIIYKLLIIIKNTLHQMYTTDDVQLPYRYSERRRNNCVLLTKTIYPSYDFDC